MIKITNQKFTLVSFRFFSSSSSHLMLRNTVKYTIDFFKSNMNIVSSDTKNEIVRSYSNKFTKGIATSNEKAKKGSIEDGVYVNEKLEIVFDGIENSFKIGETDFGKYVPFYKIVFNIIEDANNLDSIYPEEVKEKMSSCIAKSKSCLVKLENNFSENQITKLIDINEITGNMPNAKGLVVEIINNEIYNDKNHRLNAINSHITLGRENNYVTFTTPENIVYHDANADIIYTLKNILLTKNIYLGKNQHLGTLPTKILKVKASNPYDISSLKNNCLDDDLYNQIFKFKKSVHCLNALNNLHNASKKGLLDSLPSAANSILPEQKNGEFKIIKFIENIKYKNMCVYSSQNLAGNKIGINNNVFVPLESKHEEIAETVMQSLATLAETQTFVIKD